MGPKTKNARMEPLVKMEANDSAKKGIDGGADGDDPREQHHGQNGSNGALSEGQNPLAGNRDLYRGGDRTAHDQYCPQFAKLLEHHFEDCLGFGLPRLLWQHRRPGDRRQHGLIELEGAG